jgi:hypothetical protein
LAWDQGFKVILPIDQLSCRESSIHKGERYIKLVRHSKLIDFVTDERGKKKDPSTTYLNTGRVIMQQALSIHPFPLHAKRNLLGAHRNT